MSMRAQIYFWSGVFVFVLLCVWVLDGVLTPFVAGAGIAYLLNPVVIKLEKGKLSRFWATMPILSLFFIVVFGALALLVPLAVKQTLELVNMLPQIVAYVEAHLDPSIKAQAKEVTENLDKTVGELVKGNSGQISGVLQNVAKGVLSGGAALMSVLSFLVVTPIVAFYMLVDWPRIQQWLEDLLPREHKDTILGLEQKMNAKLSGFIRGQLIVMVILGAGYALAMTIAGLKYGALIGIVAGLLSIIPMVGSATGFFIGVATAWAQTGDMVFPATIGVIFIVGQLIEGNLITPKLVGDAVGLHPLWVFFALMAGGALFGIAGMLLAVPAVACIGVLAGFGLEQYKKSKFYKGGKKA